MNKEVKTNTEGKSMTKVNDIINEQTLGVALYTINKRAKSIRDSRTLMKKFLFDTNGDSSLPDELKQKEFPAPLVEFFRKNNIIHGFYDFMVQDCSSLDIGYGQDSIAKITDYSDPDFLECVFDDTGYDKKIETILSDNDWYYGDFITDYLAGCDMSDFEKIGITQEMIDESSLPFFKECKEKDDEFREKYKQLYSAAHKWLRESSEEKNRLYDLKSKVITALGINPVAYHTFSNSNTDTGMAYHAANSNNYHHYGYDYDDYGGCDDRIQAYGLYEIGGFTFHNPVDEDSMPEDIDSISTITELIPAENCLSADQQITAEEAIKILTDFLDSCQ